MSPAATDFSHSIPSSQPFSQNPNPSFPVSNGRSQPQSASFNFDDKGSNSFSLSFDFSKKGSDFLCQQKPRRIRVPVKKKTGKLSNSEDKDFKFVLRSDSLNRDNEASIRNPPSSCDNVSSGGVEIGKFGKIDFVFGANGSNGHSSGSNSKDEDEGFVFGANKADSISDSNSGNKSFVFGARELSSTWDKSNGDGNSVIGANKSSSTSDFSNGNGSFVFGADEDRPVLNSNRENGSVGGIMFGAEKSSLEANLNTKIHDFMFGADKISSEANMYNANVCSAFGAGASESSSILKSGLGNGSAVFDGSVTGETINSSLQKGNAVFSVSASDLTLNSSLGKRDAVFDASASESTFSSSLENGSFIFGASKTNLSSTSNLENKESSGTVGQSGADGPKIFDNGKFVFEKDELASESGLEQKGSSNGSFMHSGITEPGKVCNAGFVFGTDWNVGGKEDLPGFNFGAKQNGSRSNAEVSKNKIRRHARKSDFVARGNKSTGMGHEFQKADFKGDFLFGNSSKEKCSSSGSGNYNDETNKIEGGRTENGNATEKLPPSDAMRSNFKFVIGSSSTTGSAVYKIPLSKICDEMKGLNIDNSKGINGTDKVKGVNGADKVKVVGSDSLFTTENMFRFESKGKTSVRVSGKENQTLNSTEIVSNGSALPQDLPVYDTNLSKVSFSSSSSSSAASHVRQNGFGFQAPPNNEVDNEINIGYTTTPVGPDACSTECNNWNMNESYSFTANIFPGSRQKSELSASSRCVREKRLKKKKGKLRNPVLAKHLSKDSSSPTNFESPGCYSPMDFSPCQSGTANAEGSKRTSIDAENKEENFLAGRQEFDVKKGDKKFGEEDGVSSKVKHDCSLKSSTSCSTQDGLTAIRRQYRKKYKLKVGDGLNQKTIRQKSDSNSSSTQFSPNVSNSSHIDKAQVQIGVSSNTCRKADGQCVTPDPTYGVKHGECDQWRIRGNQAYKNGDLHKAEEYYTKGINSVKHDNISGFSIGPLVLCYSNRAATRMSLGRMQEALADCKSAAAVDPSFLKVKQRAANCHLVLGELQEAMRYYNTCLESGTDVCLDRRIIVEAADGLQRAQKVSDSMCQSAELLKQRTSDAASSALTKVGEGLSISCYSEKLLEMKGEALFLLRRYDEVIELCEHTLHTAEKNINAIHLANDDDIRCKNSVWLWRWCLMSKSYFHLGRLELALDLIEKQEQLTSTSERSASVNQGSSISLAATIHELLHRKKVGNVAFQSGKHSEAVEHYTAAISSSLDARPFAAICFCNRAAAHQALGLISDAIADCSLAIALDGDYLKAVSRRATLHEMIKDYKQANTDLQRLVSLIENQLQGKGQHSGKQDGSNESNKELKQARRRLSLIEEKANKETSMDFYLILGVKPSDTESDIKKAYRKAALKHHPDKAGLYLARSDSGDDGVRSWKDIVEKFHVDADRLFKMIGEAYAVLSDPDKRSKYDYEEDIRKSSSDGNGNSDSGRPDFYSSPYDRGHWSGRGSNFSSSTFERSRSRRSWHDTWRSYDNSHSQW